jgi:NAD+ kinase
MLDCHWPKREQDETELNKAIGIIYNENTAGAFDLAAEMSVRLKARWPVWTRSTVQAESESEQISGVGAVVTIGGDGTILRVARIVAPLGVPIVGVNLGRLGFMTELAQDEALEGVPRLLDGEGWVEERAMLQTEIVPPARRRNRAAPTVCHALNDVVVGRAVVSRLVHVRTVVDSALLATYRSDALIIATATGSTGYSMAARGPILSPTADDIIIVPVAAHLSFDSPVVVPGASTIELTVESATKCMVSVDGQMDLELAPDATVRLTKSLHVARFLRSHPPNYYYATLIQRLGLVWGQEGYRPRR